MVPISEFVLRNYLREDHVVALWQISFSGDPPRNEPNVVKDRKLLIEDGLFFIAATEERVAATRSTRCFQWGRYSVTGRRGEGT